MGVGTKRRFRLDVFMMNDDDRLGIDIDELCFGSVKCIFIVFLYVLA